ncbi:MAG: peptide chain release factor N(5)-glutamine methyltransferase [Candidatus Rokuibacteriota bacterium]|nr:MAG: peptide chain release factor N(5)-glutamine methyltransferase [Candidatus Rokubacteria bacterium]
MARGARRGHRRGDRGAGRRGAGRASGAGRPVSAVTIASTRAAIEAATTRLRDAGVDTARVDAEWLMAGLLGVGRAALAANLDEELTPALAARYDAAVTRRERREPLQHILGWEEFCGLRFTVTPDVLVPRPETEMLVEWTLSLLPRASARRRLAIDVGTGSGCIACALAVARTDVDVVAIDASPAAVEIARRNVAGLGLSGRVTVREGDLLSGLGACRADLVVANLPYLPAPVLAGLAPEVVDHEPWVALDGGPDGLSVIRSLVAQAPRWLAPGGALVLETAGGDRIPETAGLMRAAGLSNISTRCDLVGIERFIAAFLPSIDDGRG